MREEILAESAPHPSLPLLVSELERHLREIGRHARGHDEALAGDADNRRSLGREKRIEGEVELFHIPHREGMRVLDTCRARFGVKTVGERFPQSVDPAAGADAGFEDHHVQAGAIELRRSRKTGQSRTEDNDARPRGLLNRQHAGQGGRGSDELASIETHDWRGSICQGSVGSLPIDPSREP
jgi:hypothetical protein